MLESPVSSQTLLKMCAMWFLIMLVLATYEVKGQTLEPEPMVKAPMEIPEDDGQQLRRPERPVFRPRPPAPAPAPQGPVQNCITAFSVRKAQGRNSVLHPRKGANVRFQEVLTNVGNGWDSYNHEFVAPCNGLYYFSFHAVATRGSDFTLTLLLKRSSEQPRYQVTAYGKDRYGVGSNSVVLELRVGDRVYLELWDGRIYIHPGNEAYATFSGFTVLPYN